MKIIVTTLIFILPFFVIGQPNNKQETYDFTKERIRLSLGFGARISFGNSGNINTTLKSKADFSNITHEYAVNKAIQNQLALIGYQAKMAYIHPFGLSHAMELDIAFGDNQAFFGGYAIAWEIPLIHKKNTLSFQPGFSFLMGYSQHYIGEISRFYNDFSSQNIEPIQIGNTQYFNERLSVHITQDKVAVIYGPEIALNIRSSISNVGFQFSTGYYLSGSESEAVVIFDATNFAVPGPSALSVNSPVLEVYYKEKLVTNNPFNYGGLHASFSLIFDF